MKVTATALPEVLIIEPKVFGDTRGFFFEIFNQKAFQEATSVNLPFVQDNHSRSAKGVLRGLHYQIQQAQGKLVRVASGAVFDVAVDLRKSSPRFGQWVGVELSETNHRQLWVPPGVGHGFGVLSEPAALVYINRHVRIVIYHRDRCSIPLFEIGFVGWKDCRIFLLVIDCYENPIILPSYKS